MELLSAILGFIVILFLAAIVAVIWLLTSRIFYVVICALLAVWLWKCLKEQKLL